MASKSVAVNDATCIENVSGTDRCYETESGIPPGGYSASSSPDSFQAELEKNSGVPGESLRNSRVTPPSTVYSSARKYASVRHCWYPQSNNYYAVAATGYPAETGSRPQTTWSAVTWPEISADEVKPTSFVLSAPPDECNTNYCTKR